MYTFKDLYLNQIRTVLTSHSKEHPLFLYVALQNVHTPYEVPEVNNIQNLGPDHLLTLIHKSW